jgi:HD-like signal output (HDOD) protein
MWRDALTVGNLARRIAEHAHLGRTDIEEAHLGGLMHDVGDIVLLQNWPKDYLAIDMATRAASERELFGATHADIGGYLATLWELPVGAVDAIANHHSPEEGRMPRHMSPTTAVHVARCYVDSGGDIASADLAHDHLQEAGVARKVGAWFGLLESEDAA